MIDVNEKQIKTKKTASIKNMSAIDKVYTQIKMLMYNQDLIPGQKLMYQDLARRLNVSTTPILQALHRLESAKLVRYEKNIGFFVAEITVKEAKELFEARKALEIHNIPILIEKLTEKKIQEIKEAFRSQEADTGSNNRRLLMLRDAAFHLTIAKVAGNQTIVELLQTILERINLKHKPEYLGERRIEKVLKEHRELLEALRIKDTEKAIMLTQKHIQSGMEHMIENIKTYQVTDFFSEY